MPVLAATLLRPCTIGSSLGPNHCIAIGPSSVSTIAPPNPKTKRTTTACGSELVSGNSTAAATPIVPTRMARLVPKRSASQPATRGATILAMVTALVSAPSSARLADSAWPSSGSSGVTPMNETPNIA